MSDDLERIKKKALLQSYYSGNNHNVTTTENSSFTSASSLSVNNVQNIKDPYDINSVSFEPDLYLKNLIKEKNLCDIMDIENEVVKETRILDSEMQTLVSENYNKFISATDTIRKMRSDFKRMEEEMESLVVGMGEITEFNEKINYTFKDRREEITRLNGVDNLLKKLQFLFELPSRLNEFMEQESYSLAVKYYCRARRTLDHYKQMPTFRSIEDECSAIIKILKARLYERLDSSDRLAQEAVDLLSKLGEPIKVLCAKYVARAERGFDDDLSILVLNIEMLSSKKESTVAGLNNEIAMDILEFVDYGCNYFLANLGGVIEVFNTIFLNETSVGVNVSDRVGEDGELSEKMANNKLNKLVKTYWIKYCEIVKRRFEVEQNLGENTIIVRAVDRFYRRIQTINKQIPNLDLSIEASNIALYAADIRVNFYLQVLKAHFAECIIDLRHSVALEKNLQALQESTFRNVIDQIKNVLTNLQAFIASDVSFSAKVHFNEPFCKDFVRERLLVVYLRHIGDTCREFAEGTHDPVPYTLLLILTRLCLEFESVAVDYLLTLADEQFFINDKIGLTRKTDLCAHFHQSATLLINAYVKVRGAGLSQMIRKSVETRDWLNTVEPRNVRAVMRRVVEDLTSMDVQVGELFEAGPRKIQGSDSSRNTFGTRHTQRSVAWSYTPGNADSKLMNNIQKLFAEKIEIFSPVEFSKISVLTGIVKITLKTFLECIRLKTFSKYGLQQIQVDCHYLQLYLWRFVNDENLVYIMLEEILTSSIHRCTDFQLMEPRVVELICEKV